MKEEKKQNVIKAKIIVMLVFIAIVTMPATTKALNPTAIATTTNVTTAGGTLYSFTSVMPTTEKLT